ncbi:uncharacterized protein OCT59_026909 [Rhizophagus irregularis]|uniref:Uncharacterized protein n=4 Tax=Rhizophagus irregularis TaxID=588596 RepID=A0A916E3N4_9GLOM|nr:hypothetical protein GLOIN_2v1794892 [Rhizophagus irregularis DAOM 181602=DAOM 197198]EXX76886.1 hypothetical protein RirG_028940 [Rhizophagus irregularis DAOM 197198w]UZO06594.1 hypothetical protein OCT59_026909 [Rhizophagus irregularis]POG70786.1 hypothetical protein GLOIN_2v1794892 [Rhizophagus irregularis DAOM 181602=DAOM 197198]CAB4493039.1 unnamed protein product [Rhizophagus irregularis]CAB5358069.1 unnamed protein product [Rhizophagus irregularis]|eukprot:XP_025177652.1 hypothetical protein GLOIN_2v1794892 [Rhizophagus irregularis DAOM 181602=DAOM 197198]
MGNTNLNNHIIRDYSTGNNFVPSIIDNNENFQHTSMILDTSHINNIDMTALAPQNITFEFYLPLPNDTRIYHVTYTELNSVGIAQLLNDRINLSHILNHRLPYHYNIQNLIRQEIVQKSTSQQSFDTMDIQRNFQEYSDNNVFDVSSILPIQQPVDYQQDVIPQQSFDTMDIQRNFQESSDNNANDVSSISLIPVDYKQDTISQQPFDNIKFEFYLPLPNDVYTYHVTYTELNLTEIAQLLNNRIDLSHIPNHRLPYHYNVQRLIRQEIVQQSIGYQQNTSPQRSLDTIDVQPIYQEYLENTSACVVSSISPILQPVDYQQDAIAQQTFDTMDIQPTIQEYSDNNAYDTSSVPPNSLGDTSTTSN